MADIFISYSSHDRERVRPIADAFEQRGWDIWWDRDIEVGEPYNQAITAEITRAKCVLVLWSPQSAKSNWVYEEAVKERDRGLLVPAMIEATEIPLGFGLLQAADLTDWQPNTPHTGFEQLAARIADVLAGKAQPPAPPQPQSQAGSERKRARWQWVAAALAVVALGAGILWFARHPGTDKDAASQTAYAGARFVEALATHAGGVSKVAFDPVGARPEGALMASAGLDGNIVLWNLATRSPAATLPQQGESVMAFAYAPDGKMFASGSFDGRLLLWDASKREPLHEAEGHDAAINDIAFDAGSKLLATASSRDGGKVKLWSAADLRLLHILEGGQGAAYCVAFSPDGNTLASGSGKSIALWNAADGQALTAPFEADSAVVYDLAYSPDGKLLASAGQDGVRFWDAATRQALSPILPGEQVNAIAFSPNGLLLAVAGHDRTVTLWDIARRKQIGDALTRHDDYIEAVTFDDDGTFIASGGHDGKVLLWKIFFR